MTVAFRRRFMRASAVVVAAILGVGWMATASPPATGGSSTASPLPSVSAGSYVTCGVAQDGTAACWGDGGINRELTPPTDVTFVEVNVSVSSRDACGITTDSTVVCWGEAEPVTSTPSASFVHVAVGDDFACALRADGTALCWGNDASGQVSTMPSGTFTELTVGVGFACGLRADGTAECWGASGTGTQLNEPAGPFSHINAGWEDVCGIKTADGTVECWGNNFGGSLHDEPLGEFTQVAVGTSHACGLRPGGNLACWGVDDPRGDSHDSTAPPEGTFSFVSSGRTHSCAIATTGQPAVCWGGMPNNAGYVRPKFHNDGSGGQAAFQGFASVGQWYRDYQFLHTWFAPSDPKPTFFVADGTLPPGLTLSPDGVISGTPTALGTYTFTVSADHHLAIVPAFQGRTLTLTIHPKHNGDYNACRPGETVACDRFGIADRTVFRPSDGIWYTRFSNTNQTFTPWGTAGDIPVPGDYDGDSRTDHAVYRPSLGAWFVHGSQGTDTARFWGVEGDIPVPADYDGDFKTDLAVFRPSSGGWFVRTTGPADITGSWGTAGDIPVPADYDGDLKADMAVFRPSTGVWFVQGSTGSTSTVQFGTEGDIPVPGDYDGDFKDDIALFRQGIWFVHGSAGTDSTLAFGTAGDIPVPAYYAGLGATDRKMDWGVFRPSSGAWFTRLSQLTTTTTIFWGADGDIPAVRTPYGNGT